MHLKEGMSRVYTWFGCMRLCTDVQLVLVVHTASWLLYWCLRNCINWAIVVSTSSRSSCSRSSSSCSSRSKAAGRRYCSSSSAGDVSVAAAADAAADITAATGSSTGYHRCMWQATGTTTQNARCHSILETMLFGQQNWHRTDIEMKGHGIKWTLVCVHIL